MSHVTATARSPAEILFVPASDIRDDDDNTKHSEIDDTHPTTQRVSGGRQYYTIDDGGALVHKLDYTIPIL
jgi:hypothetical protein